MGSPVARSYRRTVARALAALLAWGFLAASAQGQPANEPPNLALLARVSATSEHSDGYRARFAVDGQIPMATSRDDVGKAWCVQGNTHRTGADFALEWEAPTIVAEVVYYGRTAWVWEENWKDYVILLDGDDKPVASGQLRPGHGPQRLPLPVPVPVRRLVLRFTSSYGGANPGAAEIRVYGVTPPQAAIGTFLSPEDPQMPPTVPDSPPLLAELTAGRLGFTKVLAVRRYHINCSHVYTYHCEGQRDGGGLVVYDVTRGDVQELVASPEGQISSCDLSPDGQQILFSWRRGSFYQVYRINVDGSGLTQLTEDNGHNYDACWLPDGDVVFLSTRQPQAAYCFFTPVGILYRMHADGTEQQRISSNYLNDFTPAVLNDGRILYGRWEYVDRPAIPIQSLWTMNPDGTGLAGFFGNRVLGPATFIEAQAIPGSTAVLCTLTGHNGSCRGALGIIDPRYGNNAQEGIRNLTPEIALGDVTQSSNGPQGPYQTPYPVDARYYLFSYMGTVLVRDFAGTGQAVVLSPKDGMGHFNARPLRPRARPPVFAGGAREESEDASAVLTVQDVYAGLGPQVRRGEVKRLCVVEELPRRLIDSAGVQVPAFDFQRIVVSCGATYVPKRVWGFVTVADDGSASFRVPAERPLYFLALDAEGRALQRMRSFTHLMPGERRGCLGCHESRLSAAPARPRVTALATPPQELTPPEWGVAGFDYASVVQPVLDRHCVRCHEPRQRAGDVDLSADRTDYFNVSYEYLARGRRVLAVRDSGNEVSIDNPYTSWIPTYNGQEANILKIEPRTWGSPVSRLATLILAGHADAAGKPRVALSRDEQQRILSWIDLNVPYYGTADTAYPEKQGCRRQYPPDLDRVLTEVAQRRCVSCHRGPAGEPAIPRPRWTRITNPQLNPFLLAPLAKEAGGTGRCGTAVFADANDPDFQAILGTFKPVLDELGRRPRMDMPGAVPAACCLAAQGTP
jgi:hypothetical protein